MSRDDHRSKRWCRARSCFPAELGNGDKFLAAATDNAWTVSGEARTSLPRKGRPSDYTEWIFLGRLDATIQRVPLENRHGKMDFDPCASWTDSTSVSHVTGITIS